jgi:hypothetical protein
MSVERERLATHDNLAHKWLSASRRGPAVAGKHANHRGKVQVIIAPDGWPLWTSDVRPGREHDTTALCAHHEILPAWPQGNSLRKTSFKALRKHQLLPLADRTIVAAALVVLRVEHRRTT